ncbi:hypothetical protein C4D60_Mb09t05200 [Musa balbisiana]|uniref:DYW domain-containing protein n=1 Tax=Musa balbisiana TaxID=52838 RepID=A0A4S8IEA2_MUSBA|nr:hypothetical protein C4D60_Mb09t05200 [Musa balbisiana]
MDWQCSSLLLRATPLPSPSLPRSISVPANPKPHKSRHLTPFEPIPSSPVPSPSPSDTSEAHLHHDCSLGSYSRMLHGCSSRGSLARGKAIHGRLLRARIEPDAHLWNCLLNMYCKCGSLKGARLLFELMPHRDVVAWTCLMAAHARANDGEEGMRMFCEMMTDGVWPNAFVLASGLKACSVCEDLGFGQQLHGEAVKMHLLSDPIVGSSLIDFYVKCAGMELAEKMFLGLPEKNVTSWNALLGGYACLGEDMKVLELFRGFMESGTMVNEFILPTVIKRCAGLCEVRQGRSLHCLVIKIGLEQDGFLSSSLVDMYSKCGLVEEAHKIFVRIVDPDVVVWSAMISGFDQQGMGLEAVELFRSMKRTGVRPNYFTLASVAGAASQLDDQALCGSLHAYILKNGFDMRKEVGNAILNMYMKNGAVEDGCMVFDTMMEHDTKSWNSLLSGFHSGSSCDKGLRIFIGMLTQDIMPNTYTYISILRSCTSLKDARYGAQVHAHIFKSNLSGDSFLGRCLVDMYASSGDLENACLVFDRLTERDVFSWTVIITGYTNTYQGEKAINCFRQMQQQGLDPNEFTISCCLGACSYIAALDSGRQFHSHAIKSGLIGSYVSSNIINMYAKCGCMMDAEAAFNESTFHDEVSWNILICGYSQHGYVGKALESFQHMIEEGKRPDEVTFVGVLSACSHAGKHDEVVQFINEMGLSSDASIWQTALGTCRMHGNVEFAERAANKLFELDPSLDSSYIMMSNLYAAAGRWEDATRMRKFMKQLFQKLNLNSWKLMEWIGFLETFYSELSKEAEMDKILISMEGNILRDRVPQKQDVARYYRNRDNHITTAVAVPLASSAPLVATPLSDLFLPPVDRGMASRLQQLRSKAVQASEFVSKHGCTYYKELMEENKRHVVQPPTIEKCQELSKQLFYTRLASIPGRYESFWKELDGMKHIWRNRKDIKVEDVGIAALFGLELHLARVRSCVGEIVGRGFTFTGYYV